MPEKKRRRKQVQDKMPMGRDGRKVKWVASEDMTPFYECIKEAALDLHFAIQMYEVELKDQGWTDEHIEEKVRALMKKIQKEVIGEE